MSQNITIKIDLDSDQYINSIKELESVTVNVAEKSGKSLEKNIDRVLKEKIVKSADKSVSSLTKLTKKLEEIYSKAILLSPVIFFLEKRFGVFSNLFSKFGLDLNEIINKIKSLVDVFIKFTEGKKSFRSVKIAVGLLLRELGLLDSTILSIIDKNSKLIPILIGASSSLTFFASNVVNFTGFLGLLNKRAKETFSVLRGVASIKFKPAGIFGITSVLGDLSIALAAISVGLSNFENPAAKFLGKISLIASTLTGGLSVALTIAISKLAEFTGIISSKLITFFDESAKLFNRAEKDVEVFNAAIESLNRNSKDSILSINTLNNSISKVASTFGFANGEIIKSAQEIALVGKEIGLTEDQINNLIKVSAEYAKVNKKDVFDTSVAIVKALNGQANSVVSLGIKLNEASLQQFAFKEGITQSINSLSESEKVQLRYNKLLKNYKIIAGVGEVAAKSLSGQNEQLKINIQEVNTALGEGARIIESNNLLAFAYNTILKNINQTVFKAAGFFGALGARLLQFGSFLLDIGFKLFVLNKTIKITNFLLSQAFTQELINKKIPLLGRSFLQLASEISGTNLKLNSFKDILIFTSSTLRNQLTNAISLFTGQTKGSITVLGSISGALSNIKTRALGLIPIIAPLGLAFSKIALVASLIIGPVIAAGKAFKEVEKRTGALNEIYNILLDAFSSTSEIFDPVIQLYEKLTSKIVELANKAFGFLVVSITKVISSFAALAKSNPFGLFSQEQVNKLAALEQKLDGFSNKVASVGFDLRKIPEETGRAIASSTEKVKVNLENLIQSLNNLRNNLRNVGLSDKEIILREQNERLETLRLAFENEILQEQEFNELREKVLLESRQKLREIEKREADKRIKQLNEDQERINRIVNNSFTNAISGGIQNVVKSLAEGQNVFSNFADFILNTFGDLAIQLGQFYIAQGIAQAALLSLDPTATISTGAALVALGTILKSFTSGGIGQSPSTSGVAPAGTVPSPGELSTDQTIADPETIEQAQEQSAVTINIDRFVGDEEEARRVADILSDAGAKSGTLLTNVRSFA